MFFYWPAGQTRSALDKSRRRKPKASWPGRQKLYQQGRKMLLFSTNFSLRKKIILLFLRSLEVLLTLVLALGLTSLARPLRGSDLVDVRQEKQTQELREGQKEEKEERVSLKEEIVVIGKTPRQAPLATVTRLEQAEISLNRPANLAEVVRQAPGVAVSLNGKNEFNLRLRGMDSQRLTLLIDGAPVYEPFFASFDLKTLPATGLEAVQVTTGAASALYGPNTFGGVVNIITQRPSAEPRLRLSAARGDLKTTDLGFDVSRLFGRVGVASSVNYQYSDGFYIPDGNNRIKRSLSDYERLNFNLKLLAYPKAANELMATCGFYRSAFGIPPALSFVRPRYWRFKDWDRDLVTLGGHHALGPAATLLWRGFWVRYHNVMEQYKDNSLSSLQAVSTYRNELRGIFLLGDYRASEDWRWRTSFSWRQELARTQDNTNLPFQSFQHQIASLGMETELTLTPSWRLVAGSSLDRLDKKNSSPSVRLNPLAGVLFSPVEHFSLRFSISLKSRFPSMQSLYSSVVGNPDLMSEKGKALEVGINWERWISVKLTAFANHFRDMIEAVRLSDGTRRFRNVTSARVSGVEFEVRKQLPKLSFSVLGTWLNHRNQTENRPLDTLPSRQVNLQASWRPSTWLRLSWFGLAASRSYWYDFSTNKLLSIPAYETADLIISYERKSFQLFFKITNIFNKFYYTEPGFPWRARYFEAGLSYDVF